MRTLPKKDVVICGLGWAGSVMLYELAQSGLDVLALERGDFPAPAPGLEKGALEQDELSHRRGAMIQNHARETLTHRHTSGQTAEPLRRPGSFYPGEVVGGAGVLWNGINTRFLPHDFEFRSHLRDAGRLKDIPETMQVSDFGITFDDLEKDYDWFEAITGTAGVAGNINGTAREGGNPFDGPRSREFPNPPLPDSVGAGLFNQAARAMGYHPYPIPAANMSRDYVNPLGVMMGACVFCGFCAGFRCTVNAKASPLSTILPAVPNFRNVEIRAKSRVLRVVRSADGNRARGVEYENADGEIVFQPSDVVVLSGYTFSNVHLMLLSGIGQPYDPESDTGVVGRGYAYHVRGGANVFFSEDVWINSFIGSGANGTSIDDFNSSQFSASDSGFFGGGMISELNGTKPGRAPLPSGTPRWGTERKKAAIRYFNHNTRLNVCGASMADRRNYLSLDPHYRDAWGRPLLRMTFDFQENERRLSQFLTDRSVEIAQHMGAEHVDPSPATFPYDTQTYQGTHNTGGAPMGTDPKTSAVNIYSQSWSVPNVFVVGGSSFPQLAGKNPTATIGALARWSARAIRDVYLKNETLMTA